MEKINHCRIKPPISLQYPPTPWSWQRANKSRKRRTKFVAFPVKSPKALHIHDHSKVSDALRRCDAFLYKVFFPLFCLLAVLYLFIFFPSFLLVSCMHTWFFKAFRFTFRPLFICHDFKVTLLVPQKVQPSQLKFSNAYLEQ